LEGEVHGQMGAVKWTNTKKKIMQGPLRDTCIIILLEYIVWMECFERIINRKQLIFALFQTNNGGVLSLY
jgi:hypothetical protein